MAAFVVAGIGVVDETVVFCRLVSWMDWNVESLMASVVLGTSLRLIVVDTFLCSIVPNVVEKPPTCTLYLSVVLAVGLFDVGISSNVLLL